MEKQQAIEILAEMAAASRPGAYICDEVCLYLGEISANGMRCDRENCNCVGGWWEGQVFSGPYAEQWTVEELQKIACK